MCEKQICRSVEYTGKKTTSINFGKRKSKTTDIGIGIYWKGTINWEHWLGIFNLN
jgi:hypothetical protein